MRLLPIILLVLVLTFAVRVNDVVQQAPAVMHDVLGEYAAKHLSGQAWAQAEEETDADGATVTTTDGEEVAAAEEEGDPNQPPTQVPQAVLSDKREFTDIEIDLLQSLSKRREELDRYAKELELKEQVLKATETRIQEKVLEMEQLKAMVEESLDKYKGAQEDKILSLVKIYENMKPKDAARIFEEIDMDILLQVASHMKEKKIALVLAKMNPTRAKELTMELAERQSLPDIPEEPLPEILN